MDHVILVFKTYLSIVITKINRMFELPTCMKVYQEPPLYTLPNISLPNNPLPNVTRTLFWLFTIIFFQNVCGLSLNWKRNRRPMLVAIGRLSIYDANNIDSYPHLLEVVLTASHGWRWTPKLGWIARDCPNAPSQNDKESNGYSLFVPNLLSFFKTRICS